jgi:hypothetical protein
MLGDFNSVRSKSLPSCQNSGIVEQTPEIPGIMAQTPLAVGRLL